MPIWSNQLPSEKSHMGFDLRRTPADRDFQGIVTAEDLLVTNTHYWGGRTVPCERPDCPACNSSVPFRTHVYLSVFVAKSHEHVIFECTANAAKAFQEFRDAQGTLRGCFFKSSRPKGTKNGKVCIVTKPADLTQINLPQAPDVMLALSVIWRLPTEALRKEGVSYQSPAVHVSSRITRQVHQQPDNAGGAIPLTTAVETETMSALNRIGSANGRSKKAVHS